MPFQSITLRPGIDVEQSPVLNSAGWTSGSNVRFFEGLPQKIGGWTQLNMPTPLSDLGRGIHAWGDNSGIPYIAIGTANSLEVFNGGMLYDITPINSTTNPAVNFSTINTQPTVTIIDDANGAVVGDRINIIVPVSVGGIVLQGLYTVVTIIDANTYTITTATNATSTVNNGGAVPTFTTVNTQPSVTVTLANHGYVANQVFTVQVSTTVGGFTLTGTYTVHSVTSSSQFVILPGGNATSSTTVAENSGDARIEYLIHSGLQSAAYLSGGYGSGQYGGGQYGGGDTNTTVITQLRYWSLSNFGQDLIANYNGSPFYVWVPPIADGNVALELNTSNFPGAANPPQIVTTSFLSVSQEMIIAMGTDDPVSHDLNPKMVRWCDAGDFTDWEATTVNQAGSFIIPTGSIIIGGICTANFNVIWTDVDMWIMSYLGAPLVWGFQKIADAVDLLAPLSAGVFRNSVIWPSSNGFYMFDGAGVRQIPCPVWDKFWFNLDRQQSYKINAQVNSWFGEISWGYPSASGGGEVDSRVTYNIRENAWTYDNVSRTTWVDDNVYGAPIGCDLNANLQQHETANDDNGAALPASITSGWFAISESEDNIFIERVIPDLITSGSNQQIQFSLNTQTWPTGPITTYGPYMWTGGGTGPSFSIVRARGRLAQITVSSMNVGTFWRLGRFRFLMSPAGKGN